MVMGVLLFCALVGTRRPAGRRCTAQRSRGAAEWLTNCCLAARMWRRRPRPESMRPPHALPDAAGCGIGAARCRPASALGRGVVRSQGGLTALHWAAREGHRDVVVVLLERGADINAQDKLQGRTALHWAADEAEEQIVELLLQWRANLKIKDHASAHCPALQHAAHACMGSRDAGA